MSKFAVLQLGVTRTEHWLLQAWLKVVPILPALFPKCSGWRIGYLLQNDRSAGAAPTDSIPQAPHLEILRHNITADANSFVHCLIDIALRFNHSFIKRQ